jgi:hypothetical protein
MQNAQPEASLPTSALGNGPLTADQLFFSQETTLARLVATSTIADTRSGLVISSNLAMLGALVAMLSGAALPKAGSLLWPFAFVASAACVASIAMAGLAALPRIKRKPNSLVFFVSIAHLSKEEYFRRLHTVPQVDFARDLADQCHSVAKLATLKFRWVRRAMATMIFAAVPWLACLEMAGKLRLPY